MLACLIAWDARYSVSALWTRRRSARFLSGCLPAIFFVWVQARMLTQRAGSFERASRRRSEHAAAENIAKHISTAQANHRERCGAELEKRDELTHIVQQATGDAQAAILAPIAPQLEVLALIEGVLDHDEGSRVRTPDSELWNSIDQRLSVAGLKAGRAGAGRCGSALHALSAALGPDGDLSTTITHRELARQIADKLDSVVQQEGRQRMGNLNILDLVTWDRLPDAVADVSKTEPEKKWQALSAYIRDDEVLDQVGADWLILALACLVLGRRILVYSACFNVAVRFTPEDTDGACFVPAAQLPPSAQWIRLTMLNGQFYTPIEAVPTRADGLLTKLDEMASLMDEQLKSQTAGLPAVMLLGLTGVGKSTMMHILSGNQMYACICPTSVLPLRLP